MMPTMFFRSFPWQGGTGGASGTMLGTCSGTDDKGKACPPDYDAERPCPPGVPWGIPMREFCWECGGKIWPNVAHVGYMFGQMSSGNLEPQSRPIGNSITTDIRLGMSCGNLEPQNPAILKMPSCLHAFINPHRTLFIWNFCRLVKGCKLPEQVPIHLEFWLGNRAMLLGMVCNTGLAEKTLVAWGSPSTAFINVQQCVDTMLQPHGYSHM